MIITSTMGKINTIANGAFWGIFANVTSLGLKLVTIPILARMLTPEEFGVVAIALTAVLLFSYLGGKGGYSAAYIASKNSSHVTWYSALLLNMGLGITCSIILYLNADFIALYFGSPEATSVLEVFSFMIIIQFFNDACAARLTKDFKFKTESKIIAFSEVISVVLALIFAFKGAGVWALVIQHFTANVIRMSCFVIVIKEWHPAFSLFEMKRLSKFSFSTFWIELANFISFNAPILIAAKTLGVSASGVVSVTNRISALPGDVIQQGISKALFPVISREHSEEKKIEALQWSTWINSILMAPVLFGFALISESATKVLLGDKFTEFWYVLCFLSISRAITSPCAGFNPFLKGIGKVNSLLFAFFLRALLVVILAYILSVKIGLLGVALSLVLSSLCSFFIMFIVVANCTKLKFAYLVKPVIKPAIAIFIMSIVTIPLTFLIDGENIFELIVTSLCGAIFYLLSLYVLYPDLRGINSLESFNRIILNFRDY